MTLRAITLIIFYSLLAGCHSANSFKNTSQHSVAVNASTQIQKDTPTEQQTLAIKKSTTQNPALIESEKERALRELLSEDFPSQQTRTLNINDPEDLFILYIDKITENWIPPENITLKSHVTLTVQMSSDGTISSITVAQSSGKHQFDEAAILAVRRIEKFNEVKGLNELDYNRYFKNHRIKFEPQIQIGD